MRINQDDPRLTAYIMGELEGEQREALERELAQCPESQAFVEQLRGTVDLLGEQLAREAQGQTSTTDRGRRPREATSEIPKSFPPWWRRGVVLGVSSAAAVLLLAVFVVTMRAPQVMYNKTISGEEAPQFLQSKPAGARVSVDEDRVAPGLERRSGERYAKLKENPFLLTKQAPLSTFSVDVDTAAYANVRRFLHRKALPPKGAVRIEELINYFSYSYPEPTGPHPFSVQLDQAVCPWNPGHRLVRIGLKGKELQGRRPASNLVFLLDVSGSMADSNKLPLLRRAMDLLVRQLTENDRVAIVVYAGASGLVLPPTACSKANKPRILSTLERLSAGGSTNGGQGIELAYNVATQRFIKGGVNRVVLATDGDFNVGITDKDALVGLIERKAKSGVFLSVLGFGMGNLKDDTMEQLADRGNGNYAYIDSMAEARKVLVEQMSGTLVTIAKDVKIQVKFNPRRVAGYRLIGYENRLLAARDFADDTKDAGEIGAGHTVTALYEVVPFGDQVPGHGPPGFDDGSPAEGPELLEVRLRYKQPEGDQSQLLKVALPAGPAPAMEAVSADFKLAAAVAWFGMELRGSPHRGEQSSALVRVLGLARQGVGDDPHGHRRELLQLVRKTAELRGVDPDSVPPPSPTKELLITAQHSYIEGRYPDAIRKAREVLRHTPDDARAIQIIGGAACYLKKDALAQWAHKRLPERSQQVLQRICTRLGIRLTESAARAPVRRDRRAQQVDTLIGSARRSYAARRFAAAVGQAEKALRIAPGNERALHIIAVASCQRGRRKEAREAYNGLSPVVRRLVRTICAHKGIRLEEDQPSPSTPPTTAMTQQAKALLRQTRQSYIAGKHALSITQARQVLKLSPGNTDAIQIIGAASCYRKQVGQAKWAYKQLRPASRNLVKNICMRNGITLE